MTPTTRPDLDDLRRRLPPPPAPGLTAFDEERLRQRVRTMAAAGDARRAPLQGIGALTLVAACLVAVAGLLVVSVRARDAAPVATPTATPAAVAVLDRMSAVAFTSPATPVRGDQFVYVRSRVVSNDGRLGGPTVLSAPHPREIWLAQGASATGGRGSVIREDGQDWPIVSGGPDPAGIRRPTYSWLASLPTDPDALERTLADEVTVADGQEPDQALFEAIGNLISENVVPPRTASALLDVVARIPGVDVDDDATDAIGRHGVGIGRTDTRYHVRSVWVFRSGTATVLGTRQYFTGRLAGPGAGPTLFSSTAVLERAVVDHPGQEPGSHA
jgi:hypothetical protein